MNNLKSKKRTGRRPVKATVIVLLAMLLISLLAGCAGKTEPAAKTKSNEQTAETKSDEQPAEAKSDEQPAEQKAEPVEPAAEADKQRSYPYTFTDLAGVQITFEKPVETVYIVGSVQPLVSLYRLYAGNSENLIECPEAAQAIIANSVFADIWPDMLTLTPHNDDANVEEVLMLNPDVVFMTGSATGDTYEALVNAGLKVVSFPTAGSGDDTDSFATIEKWVGQMAEVFDNPGTADELISYNRETLSEITGKTAGLSEEEKPSALIIFSLTDNSLKAAGSGHYSEFWLKNTGAKNAAEKISKLQEIDLEQLMEWDPDIIYLTTFSPAMPEDLYNNTIEGFDFSLLSAVKNRKVYKIPMGSYRWYAPSCECSLMLRWMASVNNPELFSDMDMKSEVTEFITRFYGKTPSEEQVTKLLNPSDTSLMNH